VQTVIDDSSRRPTAESGSRAVASPEQGSSWPVNSSNKVCVRGVQVQASAISKIKMLRNHNSNIIVSLYKQNFVCLSCVKCVNCILKCFQAYGPTPDIERQRIAALGHVFFRKVSEAKTRLTINIKVYVYWYSLTLRNKFD